MDSRTAFWQLLLAAELPSVRVDRILSRLPSGEPPADPLAYLAGHAELSAPERGRIRSASLGPLRAALESGVRLLDGDRIPENLAKSPQPPRALFAFGRIECLEAKCVAVVGTRSATTYGKAAAQKFVEALAASGVTIVSGGALGIDSAAHRAAIEAGGATVAVLPGGVDRPYPTANDALFREIRKVGCLVSPFALGASPREYSFLARNAVIAALSDAVLVVEAPERSGSLSTAYAANEIGRQVFVVPANVSSTTFRGSHDLIRNGATLVDHPDQVLDDLGMQRGSHFRKSVSLSDEQDRIVRSLTSDPLSTEHIAQRTGLDPSVVMAELTMLELEGRVIRATSGYALVP